MRLLETLMRRVVYRRRLRQRYCFRIVPTGMIVLMMVMVYGGVLL